MSSSWLEGLRVVLRRPLPERPGHVFTTLEESSYKSILAGLIIVTCAELPILHLVVAKFLGADWFWLHIALLLSHISMILWLLGDYRRMRSSGHELHSDSGLSLHLGARWRGEVPWEKIASGSRGAPERDLFAEAPKGVLKITPWDAPNLTLSLVAPVHLRGPLGRQYSAHTLELYVDEPERFLSALNAHSQPLN